MDWGVQVEVAKVLVVVIGGGVVVRQLQALEMRCVDVGQMEAWEGRGAGRLALRMGRRLRYRLGLFWC